MDTTRFDRITRFLAGRTTRRTALGTAMAGVSLGALELLATAQDATPGPSATPAEGEEPAFMFVQTAASGRGEVNPAAGTPAVDATSVAGSGASFLLTLEGHNGMTVFFSDRPDHIVGAVPTEQVLDSLGFSAANPPNAALVAEFQAGQGVVVLELIEPTYDEATETLTYGAEVLDAYQGGNIEPVTREQLAARLPAEFGPAALFIDDCPAITSCYKTTAMNDYDLVEYLGPVPGGPYAQCYKQGLGCLPCDYTSWDPLTAMCKSYYKCDMCYAWH